MSFLQNALIGNPFSTPVGSKIEQATDGSLASENWALNMEICDIINETEEGPKDAIRAIRKRLSQNAGKNYTVIMYTLTILETCVKNCGKRFHALACGKDFVQELVKLLSPKNDPPTAVQEKVLSLIQSWAGAFQSDPDLAGVAAVYKDLLAKGIEFPPTDLDSMAPIHTPRKSVVGAPPPAEPSSSPPPPAAASQGVLTPEQRAKLQSELDVVQSNMCVLGEMLGEAEPGREHPDEVALLKELRVTCDGMQRRLVDLIGKIANDSLTEELLRINDDMNNLFLRYGRWEKNRGATPSALVAAAIPPSTSARATPPAAGDSLIDFDDDVADAVSKLVVAEGGDGRRDEEFDMFAQSRTATYESSKRSGSTYRDNLEPDQVAGGLSSLANSRPAVEDREFDEMANWLGNTSGPEESVTSSDFERFLAERAAAADTLPTVTATTGSTNPSEARKSDKKRPDLLTS